MGIGAGFNIKSLEQTGGAVSSPHRSRVSIQRDALRDGNIGASVLSIEHGETSSVLLYVGAREVNSGAETTVRLFPAGTSLDTVERTQLTFWPPSLYWDECSSFSLVVSKGHQLDPLRNESGRTIFSVSVYTNQDGVEYETEGLTESEGEEISESESDETSDSENCETTNSESLHHSESDVEMSLYHH